MPLYETEALTLRDYELGEADKIIVFYTSKFGKIRAVAQGARRLNSRFGGSFEPLTHSRLIFYEKEGAELGKINQCDILNSPHRAGQEMQTSLYCIYFAELTFEFTPDRDPNENIFRLLLAVLQSIKSNGYIEPLARYFETWMMKLEGLQPKYDICSRCRVSYRSEAVRFFPERMEVVCQRCSNTGGIFISSDLKILIEKIVRNHPSEFVKLDFDRKSLNELEQLNQRLMAYHLGKSTKSYATLKQLKI